MSDRRTERLPTSLSIYLDLARFSSAMIVMMSHTWPVLFPARPLPWPAHSAVVVFFVLSGLVIAHATNRPGILLADYINHRAARLWSVALPALALSGIVSMLVGGAGLTDAGPATEGFFNALFRLVMNGVFVGQLWGLDIEPPLNAPFWSLNYEAWYYAVFGAWLFFKGKKRASALATVALIAGPQVLLLLPVLAGWGLPVLATPSA